MHAKQDAHVNMDAEKEDLQRFKFGRTCSVEHTKLYYHSKSRKKKRIKMAKLGNKIRNGQSRE
jgi:hypothetical protein